MSENNTEGNAEGNPSNDGSNPNTGVTPPVSSTPDNKSELDPSEKARRDLQSQRDRKNSELDDVKGQLDAMTPYVAKIARSELIDGFLTEHGKDYPHVKKEDLDFFGVTDADEATAVAKQLETRFKQAEQDALVKVQNTQDLTMTEQEKAEALKQLESGSVPAGSSKFLQSLHIRNTKSK